jgi:hypothetical protein
MQSMNWFAALANNRLTFVVVLVLGMALCSTGIGKAAARGLWVHPLTLAGYVLGAGALLLIIQGIFRLHLIPVENALALVLILGIVIVKIALATLYPAR